MESKHNIKFFQFLHPKWYIQDYLQIALLLFLSAVGDLTSGSSSKEMRESHEVWSTFIIAVFHIASGTEKRICFSKEES